MIAEESLYSLLSGTAGITALVSTRIYPDALPETVTYPAIVFSRASTDPVPSISNINFGSDVILNVSAWGTTRTSVDAIAVAVASAVLGTAFYMQQREAGFDPETGLFASVVTVSVFETA